MEEGNLLFDWSTNYISLEKNSYLADYNLDGVDLTKGLPHGILNKSFTGIGATYCEFKAGRKSIIVFPFRKLALEKESSYKKTFTNNSIFFVGTKENNKSVTVSEIRSFINKKKDNNIKFCVVADSIGKVVNAIEEEGGDPYRDYFLVLDEVEILQMQSSFRNNLPLCFDYFKLFKRKCLVSATLINFSDEHLIKLPKFKVLMNEPPNLILEIRKYTSQPHISVANQLINHIKKGNKSKFFIGLNSYTGIAEMVDVFEQGGIEDISILLSSNGKEKFNSKYTNEIVDGQLPSLVNIATSAFWSGIDINEKFFSIAISLNTKIHHSFSFENLVQFIGRGRKGLLGNPSLVMAEDSKLRESTSKFSVSERIDAVNDLLNKLPEMIKEKSDCEVILSILGEKFDLLYKDIYGRTQVNWLFKDLSEYEANKIKDYNDHAKELIKRLDDYFRVKNLPSNSSENMFVPKEKNFEDEHEADLEAFLSHLDKEFSDVKLLDRIEHHKLKKIRVAAYWYLFGRYFIQNETAALNLAKEYSQKVNSKDILRINQSIIEGLKFFIIHKKQYWELIKQLEEVKNNHNNIRNDQVLLCLEKYKLHFPSIFSSNSPSVRVRNSKSLFINFLDSKTTSTGIKLKSNDPKIISKYTNKKFIKNLEKVEKMPAGGQLKSYNIQLNEILYFNLLKH